ncbi:ABC-2 type transport system ATP-binding protein [Catalinimonas alkaloidigena]|uniref:ABC-2 type transport system ATP-binding protein n=1 Tax=Catalinimonas alkaloidigena TaxID=1075417 RepID=A0A1G9MYJ3_9BACT|nr:ATP-binding cassette domain-containing protein [Catalinimonas alkaloidigena]SDL79360.1 ABC-2 type transport system ATP-binding protein [Catalinimonas alkaloidigena]
MNLLEIDRVSKYYAQHQALKEVSMNIPQGSIFGMLGPNGAGKTSLIRIITQITGADTGEIRFDGERLAPRHIEQIGYLPEERGLYKKMKVGEQLMYLAQLKGMSKRDAQAKLRFWFERFEIQDWWPKQVEDLSKGMQQKAQFIATVLHEPKLIILDEPFSGFDPINANLIKDEILRLRSLGSTIIFSTHRMESVEELCDYIALINKSEKVLEGPKKEIKHQYRTNTYEVVGQGVLGELPPDFEVLDVTGDEDHFEATIRAPHDRSANRLMAALLDRVELHVVQEKIPSMNEIFIRTVRGDMPELTTMASGLTE